MGNPFSKSNKNANPSVPRRVLYRNDLVESSKIGSYLYSVSDSLSDSRAMMFFLEVVDSFSETGKDSISITSWVDVEVASEGTSSVSNQAKGAAKTELRNKPNVTASDVMSAISNTVYHSPHFSI
jgi:hypothetical protein